MRGPSLQLPRELLLSLLLAVPFVAASNSTLLGSTSATCKSGFEWMLNSNGQSPCAVVAALLTSCQGSSYTLPALPSGNFAYPGPTSTNDTASTHGFNRCLCSEPVYALLAGCADCQGGKFVSFATHTESCNSTFTGDNLGALKSLPKNQTARATAGGLTVVPAWADFDWSSDSSSSGTFDPVRAEKIAIQNHSFPASESAAVSSASASPQTSSNSIKPIKATAANQGSGATSSGTGGATSAPDSSSATASGGGGSNAGAIAGGTVGGIAILSATAMAMYWLTLKSRDRRAPFSNGVGAVPGGGSAATRVYSRDGDGSPSYSHGGWGDSSHGHSTTPPAAAFPQPPGVGGLQRQASQWCRNVEGQYRPPQPGQGQHQRQMSYSSTAQGQHQPQMSYSSTAPHPVVYPVQHPGPQPPLGQNVFRQPHSPPQGLGAPAQAPFPTMADAGAANLRARSDSQSQSGHGHNPTPSRPYIAVQTSGYLPPGPSRGPASGGPHSGSPQRSAGSIGRGVFRAIKGAIGGSPGGLQMSQSQQGPTANVPAWPVSPAGPRPMMAERAMTGQSGVTIVNMNSPYAASPSRGLPPIPRTGSQPKVSGPAAVLLNVRPTPPEIQSATSDGMGGSAGPSWR